MRYLLIPFLLLSSLGCSSYNYSSSIQLGQPLIAFSGNSLDGESVSVPLDLAGKPTLLLFGYVHKSQFDIDRWLIGLDMTKTDVTIYEIPAIKGFIPRLFSQVFDDAMREGIPKELWRDVITLYEDGDKVQRYTGNLSPKNARVVLIDREGKIVHFYDRGFSVAALNDVRDSLFILHGLK